MRQILTLSVLLTTLSSNAQSDPLGQRMAQLQKLFRASAPAEAELGLLFDAGFLARVPAKTIAQVMQAMYQKAGAVTSTVRRQPATKPFSGEYTFYMQGKQQFRATLVVDAKPPHKIIGLHFGPLAPSLGTLAEVQAALRKLPGEVSFALWELGASPKVLAALNADRGLAIGSAFKLYVLGALVAEVQAGKRRFADVIALDEKRRSWPSGVLQTWPASAPVTLHTLATQMISISDNTATDELLHLLGRKTVEKMLVPMGNKRPGKNRPLLSTRDLFLLKDHKQGLSRTRAYVTARTEARRRAYLDGTLAQLPQDAFTGLNRERPTSIDVLEWFASAADLCRAMDWLRRQTETGPGRLGRAVLAVNHGLSFDKRAWRYVGYKGGSEPGVLNLTWLLQHEDGRWLALAATWNNTRKPLDDQQLMATMQALINVLSQPKDKVR